MTAPITPDELQGLLCTLLPTVPPAELAPVTQVLHLILKAGKLASAAPKSKARRYTEKSVAVSMGLKKP